MSTFTYEAWKHIPSAFILPTNDKTIPVRQARQLVQKAGIKSVFEIKAGHCVYLSQPEVVANFIIKEVSGI